jgi:hypothetical protein
LEQALVGELVRKRVPDYIELLKDCMRTYPERPTASLTSNDVRGAIGGNIGHLEELRDRLAKLHALLVPPSLWVIFLLLAFLSVVGVTWPLGELALLTDERSWRMFVIVAGFCIGVMVLVGYFLYLVRELRELGRFYWGDPVATATGKTRVPGRSVLRRLDWQRGAELAQAFCDRLKSELDKRRPRKPRSRTGTRTGPVGNRETGRGNRGTSG